MKKSRRTFIRNTGLALGSAAFGATFKSLGLVNAFAQTGPAAAAPDYKALVCIFLFGGIDANNLVIPFSDNSSDPYRYSHYSAVRGAAPFAVTQNAMSPYQINPQSHNPVTFGFNPSLSPLHNLWGQGKLAVMCNVGTLYEPMTRAEYRAGTKLRPENLFSHEDQQQQSQTSQTRNTLLNEPIGWGGKLADNTAMLNGGNTFPMVISVAGSPPFTYGVGSRPLVPGTNLSGFSNPIANDPRYQSMRYLMTVDKNATLNASQSDLMSRAIDNNTLISTALGKPDGILANLFPTTGIGNQLKQIAKIIADKANVGLQRQIFFCSLGGWDTHTGQSAAHASLLPQLSAAMKAFYDATVLLNVASQVTTFTMSDFSRTFQPASTGTDHAWGGQQFVMGGAVNGGNFYGTYPRLLLNQGDDGHSEGRWIPTTSVDQYGWSLSRWFGLDPLLKNAVFPNLSRFTTQDLGFLP
jgi:uncharacterized protein (DUF1501 family)